MSNYSEGESAFDSVKWPNILAMLTTIAQFKIPSEALVERRYREDATNFSVTELFLVNARVLSVHDGQIHNLVTLAADGDGQRDAFLQHLIDLRESPAAAEIFGYVSGFSLSADSIVRSGDPSNPGKHHAVRNFLMEMGIVHYRDREGAYTLAPSHGWLFALARSKARPVRPGEFSMCLEAKTDLGWLAEREVVRWERNRLGDRHAHRVEHIAELDVGAGFDVLSATIEGDDVRRRFIEVKAVPRQSLRFYWTHHEVEIAKAVGPLYHLYLVPVSSGGIPSADDVVIVSDPSSAVLGGDNWVTESNVLQCQLRTVDSKKGASDR